MAGEQAPLLVGSRSQHLARAGFVGSCATLAVALFIQAFLAGVAAMTDPGWWELHRAWASHHIGEEPSVRVTGLVGTFTVTGHESFAG